MEGSENIKTPELMDAEQKELIEHRKKISRLTLEIDKILLRENINVGDLLEIFGMFTARANSVFEKIKIKELKDTYGKI